MVSNPDQIEFLIKSIKESFGGDFKCKLLYRASRDGWQISDFHRLCDEKGSTVVIVKVDNGRLCGGYCSIGWESYGDWQYDINSFVFSLDNLKKYNESKQGHSEHLLWNGCFGPCFGDGGSLDLLKTPMNQVNHGQCHINKSTLTVPGDREGNSELTGMKDYFTCADLEVF